MGLFRNSKKVSDGHSYVILVIETKTSFMKLYLYDFLINGCQNIDTWITVSEGRDRNH